MGQPATYRVVGALVVVALDEGAVVMRPLIIAAIIVTWKGWVCKAGYTA